MPPTDVSKAANRRRRAAGEDKPKVQSIDDQTPESEMSTETMVPAEEQAAAAPPKPKENVVDIVSGQVAPLKGFSCVVVVCFAFFLKV